MRQSRVDVAGAAAVNRKRRAPVVPTAHERLSVARSTGTGVEVRHDDDDDDGGGTLVVGMVDVI